MTSSTITLTGTILGKTRRQQQKIEILPLTILSKSYNPGTNVLWVRIMPTRVHNCHVQWYISSEYRWVANNIITEQEMELLWKSSSDSMTRIPTADIQTSYLTFPAVEFEGPYAGARKEPDWMVTPNTFDLPSFVIEAGWTESWDRLMDDMNLWLVGGQGKVSTVVILKWERIGQSTRVRGVAELYSLDADGMSVRRQSEVCAIRMILRTFTNHSDYLSSARS